MVDNEVRFEILYVPILGRTLPIPVADDRVDIFSAHGSSIHRFLIPGNGSEVFDPRAKLNLPSPSSAVLVIDMHVGVGDGGWIQ